jgi:hypothetical protein
MRSTTLSTRVETCAELGSADAFQGMVENTRKDFGAAQVHSHDVFGFGTGFAHKNNPTEFRWNQVTVSEFTFGKDSLIFLRSSALIASAERLPSTIVKP